MVLNVYKNDYKRYKIPPRKPKASTVPAAARFFSLLFVYLAAQLRGGHQTEERPV